MANRRSTPAWALGQRIREWRKYRGFTMQELVNRAARLGFRLPWRTLSDIERGKRKDPQLSTLLAIAATLGVEVSRLVQVLDDHSDFSWELPAMPKPKNKVEELQQKIRRKDFLIRKWKKEAESCDHSDSVGRAVKRYCLGLARWQEDERNKLEAETRGELERSR